MVILSIGGYQRSRRSLSADEALNKGYPLGSAATFEYDPKCGL